MAGAQQLRLLLWKDYLIRKRNPITLLGVVWASALIFAVYVIRINVDNVDFPTCGYPARALPSAGVLQFLQSFICSVNNECSPIDQYQQIPGYQDSKLTQLQSKFAPLLNDSTLDVASSVPDALKLVSTLADVVDEPTFIDISKRGIQVRDLFSNPTRVRRYLTSQLQLPDDVARSVMLAELSLQGILKRDMNRCKTDSISKTLFMRNKEHLAMFVNKLCSLTNDDVQRILMDLLFEINFNKYINMIGTMYSKLSGDTRILELGDMLSAVVRMVQVHSFVPAEVLTITQGGDHFSYFNVSLITKLMDLFRPTFGDTQSYKSLREFTDTAVLGLQYLDKMLAKQVDNDLESADPITNDTDDLMKASLKRISTLVNNAADVFDVAMDDNKQIDVFKVLSQLANFIYKWLPEKSKHDVMFYSTLLAKLIESAHRVVNINMNLEELTYNVTMRNPEGMKVLLSLPPTVLAKGLEALADADRAQILTSRINYPGQMFCDASKIQAFLVVSKTDATTLEKLFCTDAWKNYVSDLITSFGVFDIRNSINAMTSLVIQETLGKDTTDQLYSIEQDFQILHNFTKTLVRQNSIRRLDWNELFGVSNDSAFMKVARDNAYLSKQVLITVHGCFAKEVVKQNPILQFKLAPILVDLTTMLSALNQQLEAVPKELTQKMKKHYTDVVRVVLATSMDENKTYKTLSTEVVDIMCNGVDKAEMYLNLPSDVNKNSLISTMCKTATIIDQALQKDSFVALAIRKIKALKESSEINWTKLINSMRELYSKVERDFPYLSQYGSYNMDTNMIDDVKRMAVDSKEFWFSKKYMYRSLHLCMKLGLRLLDIVDSDMFNITAESWLRMKHALTVSVGPARVLDDMVRMTTALMTNSSHTSALPPKTVVAMSSIIPRVPQLILDSVNLIVQDSTDIEPIIALMNSKPAWPCASSSLSDLLPVSPSSGAAVRSLETVLCLDRDLQKEWIKYLADKNASVNTSLRWNSTKYEPHIFLKFSSILDAIINDTVLAKDALEYVFNDTSTEDHITLTSAWEYAVMKLNTTDRDAILRRTLAKLDRVLNSINVTSPMTSSVNALLEEFLKCSNTTYIERECLDTGRMMGIQAVKTFSIIFENVATDLSKYFNEINEPNSNILQILGFTRNTGLYILYEKMPEFIGVLLNSYWDYGFMTQVRRAALTEFWDCEAVLQAVSPALGSPIDDELLMKVQPYVCPSLIYWISLPRGDNSLLDVFAKPQYYFYVYPTQNVTSNYENAYTKVLDLINIMSDLSHNNKTNDTKANTFANKLDQAIDTVINFQINENDPSYRLFNQINRKQFYANIYLTRVVTIVSKIVDDVATLTLEQSDIQDDEFKNVESDLKYVQIAFRRRPIDVIATHFDVLTDVLANDNITLIDALNVMCDGLKSNDGSKDILTEDPRLKRQICAKRYKLIYSHVKGLDEDYSLARQSLNNLVEVLQPDAGKVTNVAEFLRNRNRKQLVTNLKRSVSYSYELGLPVYLQYLHSNVQHHDVIATFLSGGDWWGLLRGLYPGPHADRFLGHMEKSFELVEDVLSNLDKFHVIRMLRDVNVNKTESLCLPNITISDYLPDKTGIFTDMKHLLCRTDKTQIFKEIPPLVFAAQGYDNELKLSNEVNYTALYSDLASLEAHMSVTRDGPMAPRRPGWVTEDKLKGLRQVVVGLLSKETLTKMSFGVISNIVDAGTLFLNDSQCTMCSTLTTWLKQLNLQIFKKQDYDSLLCHLDTMTLEDIHHTLKNDFHWDMAVSELISTRNYTKLELNKSMNEFLELVKLHLLEDITPASTKLTECLARNVTRNVFGNATLVATVLSHVAKLLRSEMPHLHEVDGITDVPYLKSLSNEIAHTLDVFRPIRELLNSESKLRNELMTVVDDEGIANDIEDAQINLRVSRSSTFATDRYVELTNRNWADICASNNCTKIFEVLTNNLNMTLIEKELPKQQIQEFWRFGFVSGILQHLEGLLAHGARLLGVVSRVDVGGAMGERLEALINMIMQVLMDETMESVLYSLQGLLQELRPLLERTDLDIDLNSLSNGLKVVKQFKDYLLEGDTLKLEVQTVFPDADAVETALSGLGINNTNFWSVAAPRIHTGHFQLKPLFTTKQDPYSISKFVCLPEYMSSVILPTDLVAVTADDVFGAVVEQFCGMDDLQAKQILPVLIDNLNISFIINKVASTLLTKLYAASNLTEEEGATVVSKLTDMASLLPLVQDNIQELTATFANEPLLQSLKNFSSVGGLLSSSSFMQDAGSMVCGRPFSADVGRLYQAVVQKEDFASKPDQAQLDVLPTDFCRSLYRDIIKVPGGKILWSFVKPILMGKILYTPNTPLVLGIIEKANSTFARISKLTSMVHSFAASMSSVDKLTTHSSGIVVLQQLMTAPELSEYRAMLLGDGFSDVGGDLGRMDLSQMFDGFGDFKDIRNLLMKASNLLQCINLDRFHATKDEHSLAHEAVELTMVNEFSAGVVFLNMEGRVSLPPHVEYKIRVDIDNAPTTARLSNYFWTPDPESNFIEDLRYFRGFVQIQDLVDKAIIEVHGESGRHRRDTSSMDSWAVYTQQMPNPCYRKDYFQASLYESQALIVVFVFCLMYTVTSVARFVVTDKETGNVMLMSTMGVDITYHTLSWFLFSMAEMTVTVACMTLVLHFGRVLPYSDPTLIFALLFVFGFSVVSFCYLLSKMFTSAGMAGVCSAMLYLMTFLPYVIVLANEAIISTFYKLLVCTSMSSSLCYAFLQIARLESSGEGASWHTWNEGDLSIAVAGLMMLLDAGAYCLIGWLIDRYFGLRRLQSSITHCITSSEKAGVSIVNVSKIYGERSRRPKLALDNVSIELHKGQITTLLGHNGAGKTTLINILTGMLQPSAGHVTVRAGQGGGVGACPQRDVLFEYMTPAEHIALYAQLKTGRSAAEVRDEVEKMLELLSLGAVRSRPVCALSGGTRRRLCVALSFVGSPALVSLDEPTAGVDPAARRAIWSLIMKLKENRTILLTTHHLDEAELLSDQIVIMHKGQVHTTGSPVEIKRSLGNGYKLMVSYDTAEESSEEDSIQERSKRLLAVVRDVVRNGSLVDVTGTDVEIALPFYDTNGVDNDFLQLCLMLEAGRSVLGYRSYSLDCSSLEQVFFKVCNLADGPNQVPEYGSVSEEAPSKSASTASVRTEAPLVPLGPLRGSALDQFGALLYARYLHHIRNKWLLFLVIVLPMVFVVLAMGFSMIRPPPDNEVSLPLTPHLYPHASQFTVLNPSMYSQHVDPGFARSVMNAVLGDKQARNWTSQDSPVCKCEETRQVCDYSTTRKDRPQMMVLPDVDTLNTWLIETQEYYIDKRYGGFTSVLQNNQTNLVAWYNNKGHHALPSYVSALNNAILRTVTNTHANITTYSHPLKISKEQISKNTVYQHVADAGIAGLVLVAYCVVTAGSSLFLVASRRSQQKRLQLLSGVSPALYWTTALVWDLIIMCINTAITSAVMLAFGFPVFVERNNLPAICLFFMLYGYACGGLVFVCEKLFSEASLANMVLFCANAFTGLGGIAVLLILEIISESDSTDYARWVLHKVFLLSPQFALGDGLLEIAKNTVQAQVLNRFGMDTYHDPLSSDLVMLHYISLAVVGTFLLLLNLAIEYDYFEVLLYRFREKHPKDCNPEPELPEVSAERERVRADCRRAGAPLTLNTIGNINRGYVQTEGKLCSRRVVPRAHDVLQVAALGRQLAAGAGRWALRDLTLGLPRGQCTALLGQNGAGKSTLFSMLTGETRPTAGDIFLNDSKAGPRDLCQGYISYCPQSDAIDPQLSVRETLALYCRLRGIADQDEVLKRTLDMFELVKYADVQSGALSGGNKRKLCTALAFMGRSELVLLDEPTSGMDPVSRTCVWRGSRTACAGSRTVLLSSHAAGDVHRLAARVALLAAGRLRALAPLDDCLTRFGGGYVVQARARGGWRAAWPPARRAAPAARLQAAHHRTLHFLVPAATQVNGKEVQTQPSDVFRLMAELRKSCDIEDYAVNLSSLDQMFLSFSDKPPVELDPEVDPLPTAPREDELDSVTAL